MGVLHCAGVFYVRVEGAGSTCKSLSYLHACTILDAVTAFVFKLR